MGGENIFNRIADSFIVTLTTTINFYSGILQLCIYFLIFITFGFALLKMHHALQALVYCNFEKIRSHAGLNEIRNNRRTPLAVIAAGVYANSVYGGVTLIYRALVGVALAGIVVAIGLQTEKGSAAWALAKESRVEVRKVVWPTRQETTQTTLIVVAVVLFVSLVLWGLDSSLSLAIKSLIG